MKTSRILLCILWCSLQFGVISTYGPHYLDYRNGSIIINRHMAYTYMGPGHTVSEQVSVLQTVSIVDMIKDIITLSKIVDDLDKACNTKSLYTTHPSRTIDNVIEEEGRYVLVARDNATRTTPARVKAICKAEGYQLPEPIDQATHEDLIIFLIKNKLKNCLINSYFDWHSQLHISPATGTSITLTYPLQEVPHGYQCAEIDPNMVWEFTSHGTTRPTMPKIMWKEGKYYFGHFSRDYRHFPQKLTMNTECETRSAETSWMLYPPVCQRPNLSTDGSRREQDEVQGRMEQEHKRHLSTIAEQCREATIEGRHYAELTRDTFFGLTKRIGMTTEEAEELLINDYYIDKSVNPTAQDVLEGKFEASGQTGSLRTKRSIVLKLVSLFGILPFKIAGFLYQQHQFDRTNQKIENIEKKLRENSIIMGNQATLNDELSKEISIIRQEISTLRYDLSRLATLVEVGHKVNRLTTSIVTLAGYLNVKLFTLDQLVQDIMNAQPPRLMEKVAEMLLKDGKVTSNRLIPDQSAPAIALPGLRKGTIDLILNFVGVGETLDIYSIVSLPQFDHEKKVMYVRKPQFPYTAIDQNQKFYVPLDPRQAEQCIRSPCIFMGARQEIQDDPCTVGPYIDVKVSPSVVCPIEEFPEAPVFITTSLGIVFSLPFEVKAHLSCDERPGSEETYTLNGEGVLAIPPTCILHVTEPSLQFYGPPKQVVGTLETQDSDYIVRNKGLNIIEASVKARYEMRSLGTLNWTSQIRKVERTIVKQNKKVRMALIATTVIIAVLLLFVLIICCEAQKALNYAQARFIKKGFENIIKKPKIRKKGLRSFTVRWRKWRDRLNRCRKSQEQSHPSAPVYDPSMDDSRQNFESLVSIDNRLDEITKRFNTIGRDHCSQNSLGEFYSLHEKIADDIRKENESENEGDLIFSQRPAPQERTSLPIPKPRNREVAFRTNNEGKALVDINVSTPNQSSLIASLAESAGTPAAITRALRPRHFDPPRYHQQVHQDGERSELLRLERRNVHAHEQACESSETSSDFARSGI